MTHAPEASAAKRTRREGDQLRGELLQAAAALAAGPRPVAIPSLRAVARACDVSAAAVYRHFASQGALTKALLTAQYEVFESAVLHDDDPGEDAGNRLRRLARAYVRWGLANPGMYQLLFESADQLGDDAGLGDMSHAVTELVENLLYAWHASREMTITRAEAACHTERLWFGLHGIASLHIHKPGQHWQTEPEEEAERLVDIFRG
ncbi:TetR/AcrR family transcriptional regulator [Actinoplanes sp. M2I2]|uniref:TetR/AcrR family transcriptional regulator n=1 Tax=Actinoplanes sp. M2I2 TaxID=1734444 RepID=UPI0020207A06|nr:TetR/AcrR family transcriptional regulator [Actinoplanes sp. M2I2]